MGFSSWAGPKPRTGQPLLLRWLPAPVRYVRWCLKLVREEDAKFEQMSDEERKTRIADDNP